MNNVAIKTYNMNPTTFEEAMKLAELVSRSNLCPVALKNKPEDVFLIYQFGKEIGLSFLASLQNLTVINGIPSIWGDAAIALVKAHKDFEWIKEESNNKTQDGRGYICTIKRKGQPEVIQEFTVEDAKTAKLWGKAGPWTNYPKRMVQMRARSFALRDSFPDVLKGLITAEEAQDMPVVGESSTAYHSYEEHPESVVKVQSVTVEEPIAQENDDMEEDGTGDIIDVR